MSILRRIAVVSRNPELHELAQEVAHDVFVADDLIEALDIVETVTPDLTVFDESHAPASIRAFLDKTNPTGSPAQAAIVAALEPTSFDEQDYTRAGVSYYLAGRENCRRLRDIALQLRDRAECSAAGAATDDFFVDDHAASVAMVGRSKATHHVLKMITLVAQSRCNPVLILGETGTGKEVAAKAIHALRHPDEPFVAVNCAALTANLLESELFGHVKGAFTGAERDKTGLCELAGNGTIFLDEISEMPLELQAKLLRVLQERTFRKVGGLKDITCTATIIASSNRHLKKEVQEKRFRQDLYYRLNICPITLPPLRSPERRDDISCLAEYFLKTSEIRPTTEGRTVSITKLALEALQKHDWPGNVRELRNVIERALLLETTDKIGLGSIVIEPPDGEDLSGSLHPARAKDFSLEKAERELIAHALHETGWQKTQAAALLGITRATLYAKVKQYNIQKHTPHGHEEHPAPARAYMPEPVAVG
ncbi:MAG: sigma 54-interacting transcriptional regulator [Sedimentisphaerales bacterium]|nr:sigma 54-interacting transcriptional regulator [Sedimentisphaerales bacterium]